MRALQPPPLRSYSHRDQTSALTPHLCQQPIHLHVDPPIHHKIAMCLVRHSTHTNERYNDQHRQQEPHSGRQQHVSSCVGRCVQACVVCRYAQWTRAFSQHGHQHRFELVVAIDAVVPLVSQQLHVLYWRQHRHQPVQRVATRRQNAPHDPQRRPPAPPDSTRTPPQSNAHQATPPPRAARRRDAARNCARRSAAATRRARPRVRHCTDGRRAR
mmetsp:Transcript_5547/g.9285  ORF Transcript_5547/g.9285 Transcript_5547/m.9285 type:complete len:214 (+) Transcript_5547:348-989(+)